MPNCTQPQFGIEIRHLRRRKGIKQYELAAAAGIKPSGMSRTERGKECLGEAPTYRVIDKLADTPITRRRLLELGGISAAVHITLGSERRPAEAVDGAQHWLDVGREHTRLGHHAKAAEAYGIAAQRAEAAGASSVHALALALRAQAGCELHELDGVEADAAMALRSLRLPAHLAPIKFPMAALPGEEPARQFIDRLSKEFVDDLGPEAYAILAKAQGRVWQQKGQGWYADADAAFGALSAIGAMRGDHRLEAEGYHFRGHNDLRRSTVLAPDTVPEWRAVRDRVGVDLGRAWFGVARECRPPDDYVALGYDWRGEAIAWHILGMDDSDEAREAVANAQALLGGGPGLASLLVDEGRRDRSAGDDDAAARALQEALGLGWEYQSFFLVADACSKLAEVADAWDHSSPDALTYAAAAAVAWPQKAYPADYVRVERLFARLNASPERMKDGVTELVTGNNLPFTILRSMPGFNQGDAVIRLEELARGLQ